MRMSFLDAEMRSEAVRVQLPEQDTTRRAIHHLSLSVSHIDRQRQPHRGSPKQGVANVTHIGRTPRAGSGQAD
jgi:hypothetical protein